MTVPLGGKRRERKRLKRCAHSSGSRTTDSGSTGTLVLVRAEALGRALPPRIARKAADW